MLCCQKRLTGREKARNIIDIVMHKPPVFQSQCRYAHVSASKQVDLVYQREIAAGVSGLALIRY